MPRTYTPLIIGGLVIGGLILWQKAKAESDPYRAMFEAQAKAPTKIKPGRLWLVHMKDGTEEELTSAELTRFVNSGRVASYVDKGQI